MTSGFYSDTIATQAGCDSIQVLDLTINKTLRDTIIVNACDSFVWNATTYNTSGFYSDTLVGASSCDSIATLDLTIDLNDVTVSVLSDSIVANNASADSYQWIFCGSNGAFTPIVGATNQGFAPDTTGDYAVIVTQGSCLDTSVCSKVIVVGLNDISMSENTLRIYPNPTKNVFTLEISQQSNFEVLQIFTLSGKLVREQQIQTKVEVIDVNDLSNGIYFIKYGETMKKLIITK
jgi:hypothetical protein